MGGRVLALDNILSATAFFVGKWSPTLKRNQARDVLRFVICRLYDQGRGDLMVAQLTLAQTTVARKTGLSRQWIGILLGRLQEAGWLECYAPRLPGGMHGSTIFRVGRQLKRLVMTLRNSRAAKSPTQSAAHTRWHFSPSHKEKKILQIQKREKEPPKPELLHRIPLLRQRLERGGTDE